MYFKITTLLISVFLLSSSVILAQTTAADKLGSQTLKGTMSLSGEVYYSYSNARNAGVHNIMVAPNAGYFISDNFMLGLNVSYNYFKSSPSSDWFLGLGPSLEYYFGESANKFFARVGLLYGSSDVGSSETYFQPAVGYSIAISKNVALQPAISMGFGEKNTTIMFGLGIRNFIF